jgi:hypothetical protein
MEAALLANNLVQHRVELGGLNDDLLADRRI